jgi:valyl-tRNA synthetase
VDAAKRKRLEETTRWDPGAVEGRVFESWMEGGWFHPEPTGTPEENYSIAIPPPNVTGALHMGHALNGSIQDVLIRMARMRGRNTMWILGTDHAGIATQAVVEKELAKEGISRHDLGREKFVERVWEWKERYGSTIVEQYQRLGASCDYGRERFTLDEGYVEAVYKVFTALYEKGYIYRDNYMVNWDPGTGSAISDLEVENREVEDSIYEIAYPLEGGEGELVVATVRPETMLADTAVAVNPADERYKHLVGTNVELPLVGRLIPVIADEHVDLEFGTGALKITPGHDPSDFEIGREHGLDEISVIGEDGRMTDAAGDRFKGMSVEDAQTEVVEALRGEGLLRSEEPYTHSVPFSQRSGERIEPLISLQWFCRMDELAEPAIDVVRNGEVRITPDSGRDVYLDWMERIRPWCISRQLWWGHRLPVWYRGEADTYETHVGEAPPEGDGWEQDTDVLDTWFSSALWPFATLGWPQTDAPEYQAFFPTDFLGTAREILFLWVARMIMTSLEFTGELPFRDVYLHPVIQAPDGRRMSKSLGTGIDPVQEIDQHGADALRFGVLAMASAQDVRYSAARVRQGRDLTNKMWNASRLILLNLPEGLNSADVGTIAAKAAAGELLPEDRWILSRLERTIAGVTEKFEAYDFSHAVLDLYDFFFSELCDWYLEIAKPRLYDGDPGAAANLLFVLERVLALAHPVLPFVTEEIWGYLPGREGPLVISAFPAVDEALIDDGAEAELEAAIALTRSLRRWRELAGVAPGATLEARAREASPLELVGRLARIEFGADGGEAMATVGGIELLASDGIDADAVAERIEERRAKLRGEVKRGEGKLANEGFVAKAPADVVDEERAKLEAYRAELEDLG